MNLLSIIQVKFTNQLLRKLFLRRVTIVCIAVAFCLSSCSHKAGDNNNDGDLSAIKKQFDDDAVKTNKALEKYVPQGISSILNEQYDKSDKDAYLDVHFPADIEKTDKTLPVIVWIHGGGWISGDKANMANYCKILASKGYTCVSINYSLAPGSRYPAPIVEANNALQYLVENARRLHVDSSHFVLAGDSGGASVAAQLANIISLPSYAQLMGIPPAIGRSQLSGVILYGGPYDVKEDDMEKAYGKAVKKFLRAYSGTSNFVDDQKFSGFKVARHVTAAFPPSFISAGNGDELLPSSHELARTLGAACVHVDTLFFPADRKPAVPYEYQFNLDSDEGNIALARSVLFLANQRMTK